METHPPASPAISLQEFARGFTGTFLGSSDLPYFSACLGLMARTSGRSEAALQIILPNLPPRSLFGIKDELHSLRTPGLALTSFDDSETELAYSSESLSGLFSPYGMSPAGPGKFCIQVLALVSTYLDALPITLKHVLSVGDVLAIAGAVAAYQSRDASVDQIDGDPSRRACADRLAHCFRLGDKFATCCIHEADADAICGLSAVTFKPGGGQYALLTLYCETSGIPVPQFDTSKELEVKRNAARSCYENVFVKQIFPALAINHTFSTYSGEES